MRFYQSQHHLLCSENLQHQQSKGHDLVTIKPIQMGPQHGDHKSTMLSGPSSLTPQGFSEVLATAKMSSAIHSFDQPCFLNMVFNSTC